MSSFSNRLLRPIASHRHRETDRRGNPYIYGGRLMSFMSKALKAKYKKRRKAKEDQDV